MKAALRDYLEQPPPRAMPPRGLDSERRNIWLLPLGAGIFGVIVLTQVVPRTYWPWGLFAWLVLVALIACVGVMSRRKRHALLRTGVFESGSVTSLEKNNDGEDLTLSVTLRATSARTYRFSLTDRWLDQQRKPRSGLAVGATFPLLRGATTTEAIVFIEQEEIDAVQATER